MDDMCAGKEHMRVGLMLIALMFAGCADGPQSRDTGGWAVWVFEMSEDHLEIARSEGPNATFDLRLPPERAGNGQLVAGRLGIRSTEFNALELTFESSAAPTDIGRVTVMTHVLREKEAGLEPVIEEVICMSHLTGSMNKTGEAFEATTHSARDSCGFTLTAKPAVMGRKVHVEWEAALEPEQTLRFDSRLR